MIKTINLGQVQGKVMAVLEDIVHALLIRAVKLGVGLDTGIKAGLGV